MADDSGQCANKRRRLTDCFLLSVDDLSLSDKSDLTTAFHKLCSTYYALNIRLLPYKINYCNAAISSGGVTFSEAFCELETLKKGFFLGDIFRRGLDIGIEFLQGKIPEAKHEKIMLAKLVSFLKAGEKVDLDCESETDLSVLSNHLFAKLATSSDFTIDKNCKNTRKYEKRNQCSCRDENCLFTGCYGDTSIGNNKVWHGDVDAIIKNEIVIQNLEVELDSPFCRNPQLAAETIVFSFLQKKRHPELSNFLIPCIGIADNAMILMFYDSENDVLLESSPVPLTSTTCKNKFSVEAVLISWLAINYRFLCTGLTDDMLPYKAGFFAQSKDMINVYENNLTMQNIGPPPAKEIILPSEWSYNAYLLEKQRRLNEVSKNLILKEEK
ncbi:uncharacterized protein LOC133171817 [Saccostrea echinata]|uniref:uncharacterized protein LOC133171817 n=1 Tax=Saccostrea echinata TaxID=191078 RepID=UPI002A82D35A|nr:uncharacterized protein LOC133171817 [Saccostrea echinata]